MREESGITETAASSPLPPEDFSVPLFYFILFFSPPRIAAAVIHEAIVPFLHQNLDTRMSKERPKRNIIQKKYVSARPLFPLGRLSALLGNGSERQLRGRRAGGGPRSAAGSADLR